MYQCTADLTSQEVHAAKESFLDKMCNQVHSSRDSSVMPCRYLQTSRGVSGSKLDSHQFWICFRSVRWRNSCSSPCPPKRENKDKEVNRPAHISSPAGIHNLKQADPETCSMHYSLAIVLQNTKMFLRSFLPLAHIQSRSRNHSCEELHTSPTH